MTVLIRPGNDDDAAIVELTNLVHPPAERMTKEEFRHQETLRNPSDAWSRLVAVEGERLIAVADAANNHSRPPQKFTLYLAVHPEFRRRGVGTELEGRLRAFARQHGGTELTATLREDDTGSRTFLERLGYQEVYRRFQMELNVRRFDWGHYQGWRDKLGTLQLLTWGEAGSTEENLRKLYELSVTLTADVPHPDGAPRFSYEEFIKYFAAPGFRPDALFLMADAGEWVAMTGLLIPEGRPAYTYFTGVRREYRGRGLATALKLASIEYAKDHEITAMRTTNDTVNYAMVAVNEKLGYYCLPARLAMRVTW